MKNTIKSTLKEFQEFISKGSVLDLAVGVIIGGAFGKIVSSLVGDILMPIIGLLVGKVNLSGLFVTLDFHRHFESLEAAKAAGVPVLTYGNFLQAVIDFLIIGFAIFMIVRAANRVRGSSAPTTKECPFCKMQIAITATRCPHCTSQLNSGG